MRTTNQIICAVQDCQPVTEHELQLALIALSGIEHFIRQELQELIEAVESDGAVRLRSQLAKRTIERMFQAIKTPPDKWLGPHSIPGTQEQKAAMATSRSIFKKATGIDL